MIFYFDQNPQDFELIKGLPFYCQKNFNTDEFEKEYLSLRKKEDRVFYDTQIVDLPRVYLDHPHYHEWKVRERSAYRLAKQLKKEKPKVVIEVGCGNGWLINVLQWQLKVPIIGVDVVKFELKQAGDTFQGWSHFVYGDILSDAFQNLKADAIVVAASAQYFPDLRLLIKRLRNMLNDGGKIHIIDTPFYKKEDVAAAKKRSADYFKSKDASGMERYYFHHDIDTLKEFNPQFLYRPNIVSKLISKYNSPFPWIRIRKA